LNVDDLATLQINIVTSDAKIQYLSRREQQLEEELGLTQTAFMEVKSHLKQLEADMSDLESAITRVSYERNRAREQVSEIQISLNEEQSKNTQLNAQISQLQQELLQLERVRETVVSQEARLKDFEVQVCTLLFI
jgi:chromosome segregation ATPase